MGLFYVLAIKYAFKNSRHIGVGSVHVDRVRGEIGGFVSLPSSGKTTGIYKSTKISIDFVKEQGLPVHPYQSVGL